MRCFYEEKLSIRRCFNRFLFLAAGFLLFFCASAHSAPKTILVLGDSLSAEYGIERGSGWVALLEQRLADRKAAVRVVNASISGETTSGGRVRLPELLKQHRPDILIIGLGANDGLRGLPVTSIEINLRSMVTAARRTGCVVLLLGMQIPPNYGATYASQFAGVYGKVSRETNTELVPFFLKGIADDDTMFQADRLHPTKSAQPLMLENVWKLLEPMLK